MKSRFLLVLAATGLLALTGVAGRPVSAEEAKKAACPVSGQPAKTDAGAASSHINGQTVQFCCANCPTAFAANPEKFAAKMALTCPVMKGSAVKPAKNLRLAVNNGYVYVCCAGCTQPLVKSPEKFLTELRDPVSGQTFKLAPNQPHVTYKGAHFYFANEQNKATFEASPEKYARITGS